MSAAIKRRQQPLIFPGLGDEIGGALFHRLHRQLDIAMGGDQHHHGLRDRSPALRDSRARPSAPSSAPAVKFMSSSSTSKAFRRASAASCAGSLRVWTDGEMPLQQQPGGLQDVLIVVDDQDAGVDRRHRVVTVRKRTGVRLTCTPADRTSASL